MLKRILLPLMAVALLLLVVSCSNTPSDPTATDQANTTDEFGGYTATDEAPAFGDPELIAEEGDEQPVDDSILYNPDVQNVVNDSSAGIFHFRAIWGRLRYDSSSTTPTDWSGSLTASRGALVLRRLIRFELNQDGYYPRTDRNILKWFSTTTVHNDGIVVDLYVPPVAPEVDTTYVVDSTNDTTIVLDTLPVEPVTLAFQTGPYSRTFTLPELAKLDTVVTLPDSNAIVFQSYQLLRVACPRGNLVGQWGYDDSGNGVFQGLWMSHHPAVIGFVRGHFGVDDNGNNTFWGKWIGLGGQFEGLIRGTWIPSPSVANSSDEARVRSAGKLRGIIYDGSGIEIGKLQGQYKSAAQRQNGWFGARWKLDCNGSGTDSNYAYYDGF